jgi:hypothetical protein
MSRAKSKSLITGNIRVRIRVIEARNLLGTLAPPKRATHCAAGQRLGVSLSLWPLLFLTLCVRVPVAL